MLLLASDRAAPPRTLVDVLAGSAARHPTAPALDDGTTVLDYTGLLAAIGATVTALRAAGVRRGDRVGVRLASGSNELYVSILAVLHAGAAYVPVDADDPDERARVVFAEAFVSAVVGEDGVVPHGQAGRPPGDSRPPSPDDDAWVIFTSGSTGVPKGVAVTHRSASAFVDAEARLFAQERPLGPGDRVLAGLSVAFDASCEEMWLAWRHGACLVPAPRALVRSGADLGPWLVEQRVTVVSTVPTLASLWPGEALGAVRLLIFGGEACPPELADRLAVDGREVWNTYGPTEATVVACAARLMPGTPVRIGLPLDGWDLAVVDAQGDPVAEGEVGELMIGGVGLARYLDAGKDATTFAPMPSLGWQRAYRSGDLVRAEGTGLVFVGRADDQVKVGGRRIELGEVDSALLALPGVVGAAAAVRATAGGNQLLVGYVVTAGDFDRTVALQRLRTSLPAALVPRIAVVDDLPTRTSGKVDRDALPWPLADHDQPGDAGASAARPVLTGTAAFLAAEWERVLGVTVTGATDDFFDDGGTSLGAAQLVSALRARFPEVTVADVYENPTLGALAATLDEFTPAVSAEHREVKPVPVRAQVVQWLATVPLATLVGLRWLTWAAALAGLAREVGGFGWAPQVSWWLVAAGWAVTVSPPGRLGLSVAGARLLLRGVRPGSYPRGGSVHLRLWAAEALATACGVGSLAAAPWVSYYARALGAKVGRDVDLHALPPVTGLLTLGPGSSVEPEVDLAGHWLDGDVLHLGRVRIGAGATVGRRSTLLGGARVGQGAQLAAGSAVAGAVPPGEHWGGSPARRLGIARHDLPARRPPRGTAWVLGYGATSAALAALPLVAAAVTVTLLALAARGEDDVSSAALAALPALVPATVAGSVVLAGLTLATGRALGRGLVPGHHAVRGRIGWQAWATERLLDEARSWLYPLYASSLTPSWLRALGARIGSDVEASTVLLLPPLTTVGDGAFLADDTLVGSYELGGGWMRLERAKVGKGAFLGNSGMIAPGRAVPKRGLVAVLSAAPEQARRGTSWIGSPPVQLRRTAQSTDSSRTSEPATRLRVWRALVEVCRLLAPVVDTALAAGVLLALAALAGRYGLLVTALLSAVPVLVAGVLAATVAVAAKWLLVGRIRTDEHPLWSSFVWRGELADAFVEVVAARWFARAAVGTPALALWLRAMGAHIGRGVWCESYWLPEADLVDLGDGVSVGRGCVLQTHLFHDRVMSVDGVRLGPGATLAPHGVVLPAASIGAGSTVGPASLVLRGDDVPPGSRWAGNPIAPDLGATRPSAAADRAQGAAAPA